MTERQQKSFYFPAWNGCAEANDWRMEKGRLVADLKAQISEMGKWSQPACLVGPAVIDYAEQLAAQEHRAVTAEDLRHGCNLVATAGRKSSSGDLNNHEVNRVVCLFRLLRDPENLDAVMAWLHPEESDRKSLANYIRKLAPDATMTAIAKHAFGTIFWEDLDAGKLKWILKQVKGRKSGFNARAQRREEEFVGGPF